MLVQTVKVTATVAGINVSKRQATLLADDGTQFDVRVARGAIYFDQLRAGDNVTATLTESVRLTLMDGQSVSTSDSPANATRTQRIATVIEINKEQRTVSFRFDNGEISSLPVREDYDLNRHTVGEQLDFCTVNLVADWIEKVP